MWLFLGYANVPIDELSYNATSLLPAKSAARQRSCASCEYQPRWK